MSLEHERPSKPYRVTPLSYDLIMVRSLHTSYDQPVVTDGMSAIR